MPRKETSRLSKPSDWAACALLFLAGVIIILLAAPPFIKARQSAQWTPVPATLVFARLIQPDEADDYYKVEYEYKIHGQTYRSTRINFGPAHASPSEFSGLHPGQNITIYANPDNPAEAVVLPGHDGRVKGFLTMGAFLIVLSISAAWAPHRIRIYFKE